jgi:predicted DNA binding CopG/RHH family protein
MSNKIPGTVEAWETQQLGADEQFAEAVVAPEMDARIDQQIGLKLISIRIPEQLIEDFKLIASVNGSIGYQTLMKQCLKRFADSELKRMARDMAAEKQSLGVSTKAAAKVKGNQHAEEIPPAKHRKVA